MHKHLTALVVIFIGASLAWAVLGATLVQRTADSDDAQRANLSNEWGAPQVQTAPDVTAVDSSGKHTEAIPLQSSTIDVGIDLEQRRKGLLWYNLYNVDFSARYGIENTSKSNRLSIHFPLSGEGGTYADLICSIDGKRIDTSALVDQNRVNVIVPPGKEAVLSLAYRSRGAESWAYQFKSGIESVNDFSLTMTTNFKSIDFAPQTLSPVSEVPSDDGYRLAWNYETLVTADSIGIVMPSPLQPGPLAQRITFWAPVALLFYLFVMLLITTLRNIDLHPVNYFFLTCAFFAFHLLFAYLVDRVPLIVAFTICSAVSMFLTISYLRLVAGWHFAAVESGLAQLIYLVLFSYALFNEGWSGLTITTGAIITLFVAMQFTGRIRWSERLGAATQGL